jgi:dihydroorotase
VTVFDPYAKWVVDPNLFLSKGRNTPWKGKTLTGRATCTIVGGRIVYRLLGEGEREVAGALVGEA